MIKLQWKVLDTITRTSECLISLGRTHESFVCRDSSRDLIYKLLMPYLLLIGPENIFKVINIVKMVLNGCGSMNTLFV